LVSGLGGARLLQDFMPLPMLMVVVSVLILFSTLAFVLAAWRYSHLHLRLEPLDIDATPLWLARSIGAILGCVRSLRLSVCWLRLINQAIFILGTTPNISSIWQFF